jgi:hypothetical protein
MAETAEKRGSGDSWLILPMTGSKAAGFDFRHRADPGHPAQMVTDRHSFHVGDEQHFNVGSINNPMGNHFLERPRFAQELGESLLPASNDGAERIELGEEILSAVDYAFVVKRYVVLRVDGSATFDGPFEIFQIAPMIAVVGAKG